MRRRMNKKKRNIRIYYPFFKRITDIVVASFGIIACLVLFPFLTILIKLDSKGPVIYTQERIGKDGVPFKVYKFRTMYVQTKSADKLVKKTGTFVQKKDDPRVTNIGSMLRKLSIDEFPQMFNILKGEMSFIGPRPFIRSEIEMLNEHQLRRLSIKPGLTGYAQINGRNDLSLDERMEKDLFYVDNITMLNDMRIFLKSIFVVYITRKGVY